MTQEEKQILLADLCARLPYGVMVKYRNRNTPVKCDLDCHPNIDDLENTKPYLRPMSSMTEEEQQDFKKLICEHLNSGYPEDEWSAWLLYDKTGIKNGIGGETLYFYEIPFIYDWLNAHHFDYRGLIDEGLALEAHKDMYNIK